MDCRCHVTTALRILAQLQGLHALTCWTAPSSCCCDVSLYDPPLTTTFAGTAVKGGFAQRQPILDYLIAQCTACTGGSRSYKHPIPPSKHKITFTRYMQVDETAWSWCDTAGWRSYVCCHLADTGASSVTPVRHYLQKSLCTTSSTTCCATCILSCLTCVPANNCHLVCKFVNRCRLYDWCTDSSHWCSSSCSCDPCIQLPALEDLLNCDTQWQSIYPCACMRMACLLRQTARDRDLAYLTTVALPLLY